jgi:hypothetical protein
MRTINVDFIEMVFKRIIEKLRFEVEDDSIEINVDFYLNIPTSEWDNYEHSVLPESLSDDIDSLELLVKDKERVCTYVDFDRVASLLRAISQIKNPVK